MNVPASPRRGSNAPSHMFFWPTADRPFVDRDEGIYVWDTEGRRYVDACAGPQTCNIGHGNERVRRAMLLMEQHLGDPLSVEEIARRVDISKRQL